MLLAEDELVDLVGPELFIVIELALNVEVHHRVHLLAAPQVRAWVLRVLAHIYVQLLLLLEFFTDHEITLLDHELDWKAVFLQLV